MTGGHRQGFPDTYGYRVSLIISVAMILAIIFFIFFRCNAIFRDGADV